MSISQGTIRISILFAIATVLPASGSTLVSVDFRVGSPSYPAPTFTGVEPAAAAADSLFAAASDWNDLKFPFLAGSVTNPSFSKLVDSAGVTSSVGFSIKGTVLPINLFPFDPFPNPDPLRTDSLAFNSNSLSGLDESTSITWQITGLVPGALYDIAEYGARADIARSFDMTIGSLTFNVPTLLFSDPQPSGAVLFRGIMADSSGAISGTGTGIGSPIGPSNEADWAGFQIAQVPEPSGLGLLGAAMLGMLWWRCNLKIQRGNIVRAVRYCSIASTALWRTSMPWTR